MIIYRHNGLNTAEEVYQLKLFNTPPAGENVLLGYSRDMQFVFLFFGMLQCVHLHRWSLNALGNWMNGQ